MVLDKKEIKRLKGLAHHIKPISQIGKEGISEAVIKSSSEALKARELIKIKFLDTAGFNKSDDTKELEDKLDAKVIAVIGFTVIVYRFNKEKEQHI